MHLPLLHVAPVKPAVQAQVKVVAEALVQTPPFWQGLLAQGLIAVKTKRILHHQLKQKFV